LGKKLSLYIQKGEGLKFFPWLWGGKKNHVTILPPVAGGESREKGLRQEGGKQKKLPNNYAKGESEISRRRMLVKENQEQTAREATRLTGMDKAGSKKQRRRRREKKEDALDRKKGEELGRRRPRKRSGL